MKFVSLKNPEASYILENTGTGKTVQRPHVESPQMKCTCPFIVTSTVRGEQQSEKGVKLACLFPVSRTIVRRLSLFPPGSHCNKLLACHSNSPIVS